MRPNKTTPPPSTRNASATRPEEASFSGGSYEVGVELQDVGPALETYRGRARSDRCARQRPRSMCFLVEDCKWCRPDADTQAESGTLPEQEETAAVRALKECLANLDRDSDRSAVEVKRDCLDVIIERYVARRRKSP